MPDDVGDHPAEDQEYSPFHPEPSTLLSSRTSESRPASGGLAMNRWPQLSLTRRAARLKGSARVGEHCVNGPPTFRYAVCPRDRKTRTRPRANNELHIASPDLH